MIHGLAALPGGFDGDSEILLESRLASEVGEGAGPQRGFELPFAFQRRWGCDAFLAHELPVSRAIAPVPALCGTTARTPPVRRPPALCEPPLRPRRAGSPGFAAPTARPAPANSWLTPASRAGPVALRRPGLPFCLSTRAPSA